MVEDFLYTENPLNPEVYDGYTLTGKVVDYIENTPQFILQMRIDGKYCYVYITKQQGEIHEHTQEGYEYLKRLQCYKEKGKRIFNSLYGTKKELFIKNLSTKLDHGISLIDEEESVVTYLEQINLSKRYAQLLLDSELSHNNLFNEEVIA